LVEQRTEELQSTRLEIIVRLGRAAEFKDYTTGNHIVRMSQYSRLIAEAAGLGHATAELLLHGSPMHDVGKIGIPDSVLLKSGKLNSDEWKIMQRHAAIGAEIIGEHKSELLMMARAVALTHHEKWDGSGYPQGLREAAIPIAGRIVAIADVFDALTSVRPYKKAWSIEQAVQFIDNNAGIQFDPGLIPAFKSVLPDILKVQEQYKETHEVI
jgi:putative two-component system response regulator